MASLCHEHWYNRGSETIGPVGPVGHRDLRFDPDTSFAGVNVRERSRKPRMLFFHLSGMAFGVFRTSGTRMMPELPPEKRSF